MVEAVAEVLHPVGEAFAVAAVLPLFVGPQERAAGYEVSAARQRQLGPDVEAPRVLAGRLDTVRASLVVLVLSPTPRC